MSDEPEYTLRELLSALWLVPMAILIYNCYIWLKRGHWQPLEIHDALQYLGMYNDVADYAYKTEWRGVAKVIEWTAEQGLFSVSIIIALLIIWLVPIIPNLILDEIELHKKSNKEKD